MSEIKRSNKTDALIGAFVIFRHGERNISFTYPNDPYKDEEKHWPGGFGQLTNKGKWQLYRLGQHFRSRYEMLIGSKYSSNKIYMQSTNHDRSLVSAQVCLAGLFPPIDEEIWNDEIMWQPIPVHTIPSSYTKSISEHRVALDKYINESPDVQRIFTEYADLFKHWTQMSGMNITTIGDIHTLYKTLSIEKKQNKLLPDWANKAIEPNGIMEYITKFNYKLCSITPQLAKLRIGVLIKEIIDWFLQKQSLQSNRSLWLYSAHAFTISDILSSLELFELHIPPYAASLHFELYKSKDNEHYFQMFYRKSDEDFSKPLNIPRCGEKCSLNEFYNEYKDIIPCDLNQFEGE